MKRVLRSSALGSLLCASCCCLVLPWPAAATEAAPTLQLAQAGSEEPLNSEIVRSADRFTGPGSLDFPRRRHGLWEIRNSASEQLGVPPVQFCVGEQTDTRDNHLDRMAGRKGACQGGPFKRSGINWVSESVCKDSRTRVVSQSIATGDFQTRYRIDTLVFYSPPLPNNKREDRESLEARYLGPCPDGQKANDLTIPGLGILNMQDGGLSPEKSSRRR